MARTLRPYVDELVVCDPRENDVISKCVHKADGVETYNLCRLTRLGELMRVFQANDDHRAIFKSAAQEYMKLRNEQAALKQRIKAKFRRWGVWQVDGQALYRRDERESYLAKLQHASIRREMERRYELLDAMVAAFKEAWRHLQQLGRRYAEIAEFIKMAGMGPSFRRRSASATSVSCGATAN